MGEQRESFEGLSLTWNIRERSLTMEALNLMDYPIRSNSGQYTIEEVSRMENHAELVDGKLIITDKTTVTHQRAVREIVRALEQFIRSNKGGCEVFAENIALYCNELCDSTDNFFLPDVMSVCDKSGIKDDGVHTAPRFVAEITSVSTRKQDYIEKMAVYAKIGVQEYCVVDLQRKIVVRYLKDNDFIPEMVSYSLSSSIPVHTYPNLEIDLSGIFE